MEAANSHYSSIGRARLAKKTVLSTKRILGGMAVVQKTYQLRLNQNMLGHNGDEKEDTEDYKMHQALEHSGAGGPERDH